VPNILPESELVALLKNKEKRGFDYLYANYSTALFGIVNRIIPDEDDAKDVLQDVFVKIWNNIESYSPKKGRFFTWMLNLSRNMAIDKLRSANYKYHNKNLSMDEKIVNVFDKNQAHTENVNVIGLRKVVSTLKVEYRELIELAYFSGFTQVEISEKLEIPLGTVKTRLRSAIKELRIKFD
jgi:RNA polymerase sigma-70 factor (ECF subfamily)